MQDLLHKIFFAKLVLKAETPIAEYIKQECIGTDFAFATLKIELPLISSVVTEFVAAADKNEIPPYKYFAQLVSALD